MSGIKRDSNQIGDRSHDAVSSTSATEGQSPIVKKLRDVGAVASGRVLRQVIMIIVMAIAARLLGQEMLGAWALVFIIVQFGVLLSDSGISTYVVREQDLDARGFATAFYCSAILAVLIASLIGFSGTVLARLLGYQELAVHIMVAGLAIVPLTVSGLLQSKLRRDRRFESIFASDLCANLCFLMLSLFMLSQNAGLWALIVPTIVSALVAATICALTVGLPRPQLDLQQVKAIADYSVGLVGFSSIYYWARNADHVLIGRFLGAASLGVYSIAYRIMMLPLSQINATAHAVALPYLSRHQDSPAQLNHSLRQITVVIGMLTTLPMTWVFLQREFVVEILLGAQWGRVADILAIFAPLAILQALVNPIGLCYQISGRTKLYFVVGMIHTVVTVASFVAGVWTGSIEAVAIFYAVANFIMVPISVGFGMRTIAGTLVDWIRWCLPFMVCLPICLMARSILPRPDGLWPAAVFDLFVLIASCTPLYAYAAHAAFPALQLDAFREHRVWRKLARAPGR